MTEALLPRNTDELVEELVDRLERATNVLMGVDAGLAGECTRTLARYDAWKEHQPEPLRLDLDRVVNKPIGPPRCSCPRSWGRRRGVDPNCEKHGLSWKERLDALGRPW